MLLFRIQRKLRYDQMITLLIHPHASLLQTSVAPCSTDNLRGMAQL